MRLFASALPQKFKIPVFGGFKIKTDKGSKFHFYTNYTSWHGRLLFWDGVKGYEHEVTSVFSDLISDSRCFLDIGANIGYYSLMAASINPELEIHAFEPLPDAQHFLKKSIGENRYQNIRLHQIALSDVNDELTFETRVSKDFPNEKYQIAGDSSLVNYDQTDRKQIKVKAQTLDDFVNEHKLKDIDYIKLDTETTEHLIIKGGMETIKQFQPILQCEVIKNQNEKELESLLKELKYTTYLISEKGLVQIKNFSVLTQEKNDCLFVPEGREV